MEDKLPSNESDVWTLSNFIERRKDWDQKDEARLVEYLQKLSNKITQGAKNTLNELDDLVASIDDTAVQIANVNNEFQLLADKQFIENKVQEEDETVQIKVEKPVVHETNSANTLVNNLKEALKNSFNAIDSHFEKVTVVVSDSDDDDELKHEETILRPRTFYKKLNLPSLSGNTQSEIAIDSTMSSDSDSVVEHPTNAFKDEESVSSNDIPEEDNHSAIESNIIDEPSQQLVDTYSNMLEPEKFRPKPVPAFADNDNVDDLFRPPPLLNDFETDDLENDYNIFGNNSNMYGERTLWDDDDDDDDFSNEPPLPIHSDESPQQVIKSNTQEKTEVPSIQQSLNAELRKRFQKDDISPTPNNINIEPSKIKLQKGAVNILDERDVKLHDGNPDQNTKQATISQISENLTEKAKNRSFEDMNNSNKLFNESSSVTFLSKNLKTETQTLEKQSLFQQDSDDEDLFVEKKPIVISASKSDIPKQKENPAINIKSSRTIFSDSDSDDDFINSKSTSKTVTSHNNVDNSSIKLLDSSSEDDLFNVKSINNMSILKQKSTLFPPEHNKICNEPKKINNAIKQNSESFLRIKNDKQVLNNNIFDESMKNNTKESNVLSDNTIIRNNSLPNNNTLNRNIIESPPINNTIKSSNSEHEKKLNNLFSSDEDDFDDDIFLNVNKMNNSNRIKKDKPINNSAKLITVTNTSNNEGNESKVKMFDSSSDDDDIFNTNKSNNNLISSKNILLSDSKEIKTIGLKLNDDCAIINENTENLDKTNSTEKNLNIFNFSSDDDEDGDDNYLSFNSNSDRSMNISNTQNLKEIPKAMSLSSEEFLSPQTDLKIENVFHSSSSENFFNKENQNLINKEEIDILTNETLPIFKEAPAQNNDLSTLSSSDDEQLMSFNSNIHNENTIKESKKIYPTSNSSLENVFNNKNQDIFIEENVDVTNNDILFTSTENKSANNQSFMFSSSEVEEQVSFNSNIHSKKTKEIHSASNLSLENVLDKENQNIFNEENINTINDTITFIEHTSQTNQSSLFSNSDDDEQLLSYDSKINNIDFKNNTKLIDSSSETKTDSKEYFNDSTDGSSLSTSTSKNDQIKKLPGKLNKNAGAFINISGLVPNSKKPLNISAIPKSVSLDEKSDENFPTSGTKLFSAEKERVKIQVKRRPQSRKARITAARMSSIDTGNESNFQESSRLFGSTSDLVDYQSTPILNATDFSDEIQNKILKPLNNKLVVTHNDKMYEDNKKTEINNKDKKQSVLDLFDNDSNSFESSQKETNEINVNKDNKEKIVSDIMPESKTIHKEHPENKSPLKQIKVIKTDQTVKELKENQYTSNQNTKLSKKYDSLFDDDDDIFSSKTEKVKKTSSNLFDSDDEFDFNQKSTKKTSLKANSIFGDDSDDDLFSSTSKLSISKLPLQKSVDKLSQWQNRSSADGYVKLAAESVAINPLESKKT